MIITVFSFCMAILWFDALVLLSWGIQKKTGVLLQYSLLPLVLLCFFAMARIVLPIEFFFTKVFHSEQMIPSIQRTLGLEISFLGLTTTVLWLLVALCSTVSLILLIRLFVGIYRSNLKIKVLYAEEDERAQQLLQDIIAQTKPGRRASLFIAPGIPSPVVTGFFHPVILMPEEIRGFSDRKLEYILRHEWGHFLSKDLFIKLSVHILSCIMWWNPPVYLLKKHVDQVLELSCDRRVIRQLTESDRLAYLETVLDVLKKNHTEKHLLNTAICANLIGVNQIKDLRQRFELVYDYSKCRATWKSNLAIVTMMACLFIASYVIVLQPYNPPPLDSSYIMITPENAYLWPDPLECT